MSLRICNTCGCATVGHNNLARRVRCPECREGERDLSASARAIIGAIEDQLLDRPDGLIPNIEQLNDAVSRALDALPRRGQVQRRGPRQPRQIAEPQERLDVVEDFESEEDEIEVGEDIEPLGEVERAFAHPGAQVVMARLA